MDSNASHNFIKRSCSFEVLRRGPGLEGIESMNDLADKLKRDGMKARKKNNNKKNREERNHS